MFELLVDHESDPPPRLMLWATPNTEVKMLTVCYPPVRAGTLPIPLRYASEEDAKRALDVLYPYHSPSQKRVQRVK